jgi:glycosyltransferase involved in cell wall biosynthesis
MCANALFYNDKIGLCEKCLTGSRYNAIKYRCVFNSRIFSLIKVLAQKLNEHLRTTTKIDAFIVPSTFTLSKLEAYGIPLRKLNHLPTFFNFGLIPSYTQITYQPFALYIGRIEKEKGLLTLIKAFQETSYNLKIIGFSNNGYEQELKEYLNGKTHNVEFLGKKNFNEISVYLSSCMFTIVPSEWYDNFPNSVLESFAFKKAVIASKIGSLKELVKNEQTGLLFEVKSVKDLREKIERLMTNTKLCKELGESAYGFVTNVCSEENHYKQLISIFNKLLN